MLGILQVTTVVIVAIAMALSLAHALELPGKMRLPKAVYFAVQRIYYPGFTIAGISEPAGIACAFVLCFLTPRATLAFWLTVAALLALVAMQVVYWVFIHAINKVWMQGEGVGDLASGFFGSGRALRAGDVVEWTDLRNRWEYAHVVRAVLGFVSFVALLIVSSSLTA